MSPAWFDRFGRRLPTSAVLTLLAAALVAPLGAQSESSACQLLQVSELEAALGGKVSAQPEGDKQSVPGMTVDECSLTLRGSNQVHPVKIVVVSDLSMEGAEAIRIRNAGTAREQQWKVAGARLEQATVGSAICILAGRPSVASSSTCSIPRGKGYLEVEVIGAVDELPSLQTVGELAAKALGRL